MRRSITVAIGVLLFCAVVIHLEAATITVTNTNDSGPGSLRQALANNGDTINFPVTGTIALTSGGLVVTKNVTISGPGANELSIDGNQGPFVFSVDTIATISGLTIRNGHDGIANTGMLTVSNCVISGNSSDGIANNALSSGPASLTVVNSNVRDNDLSGIFNTAVEFGVVTATIRSTTVSGNSAGGVLTETNFSRGNVFITDCTISGNSAGGVVAGVNDFLSVANSTISGNSGTNGAVSRSLVLFRVPALWTAPLAAIQLGRAGAVSLSACSTRRCALQIARSPATRHLLAGAFISTGNLV